MCVTSKAEFLNLLVDFLNVDLSTDPRPDLKKNRRLKKFLNDFQSGVTLDTRKDEPVNKTVGRTILTGALRLSLPPPDWVNEARRLQKELKIDLFLIAARREFPEKLYHADTPWLILVEKLNQMRFRRRWTYIQNKQGFAIRAENVKRTYSQRHIVYAKIAELLESGGLQRLRLCFICHRYFVARDQRQRFCSKECGDKFDNLDAKNRVRRYRKRQKRGRGKKDKQEKKEKQIKNFSDFMTFAKNHPQDIFRVGRTILKLGQGDGLEGWKRLREWEEALKNGVLIHQIFNSLPEQIKNCFG